MVEAPTCFAAEVADRPVVDRLADGLSCSLGSELVVSVRPPRFLRV